LVGGVAQRGWLSLGQSIAAPASNTARASELTSPCGPSDFSTLFAQQTVRLFARGRRHHSRFAFDNRQFDQRALGRLIVGDVDVDDGATCPFIFDFDWSQRLAIAAIQQPDIRGDAAGSLFPFSAIWTNVLMAVSEC
jgi:hypothetical protein